MTYYFNKTLPGGFDETIRKVMAALTEQGFGIVSDIDMREAFKKKLGTAFRNYRILGACNPALAFEALNLEDKIGTMLPCNVVVQDIGEGRTEVAAIDPVASMQAVDNPRLKEAAARVRDRLKRAVDAL